MARKAKSIITVEIQLIKKRKLKENLQRNMNYERNTFSYSTMAYLEDM